MDIFVDPRNDTPRAADSPTNTPSPPEEGWAAWYLRDEDDVGESTEQGIIVRTLLAALTELARERGWARTLVAGDQFFAWVESEPQVRISPDVYLLDDPPPPPYPGMWRTWLPGHAPPRFAVEVVSDDWAKDYLHAPRKYQQLGTRELVVFDPDAALAPRDRRVTLQVFRRDEPDDLGPLAAGEAPVHSAELDAWLVVQPDPRGARLRIARDAAGADLVPTSDELVSTLRATLTELHAVVAMQQDLLTQQREIIARQADTITSQAEMIDRHAETITSQAEMVARQADTITSQAAMIDRQAETITSQAAMIDRQAETIDRQAETIDRQAETITSQAEMIEQLKTRVARQDAVIARQAEIIASQEALIGRFQKTVAGQDALITRPQPALPDPAALFARPTAHIDALEATLAARDERDVAMKNRVEALEAALARLLGGAG